jgi:DNA anti-recombination protein RmuC
MATVTWTDGKIEERLERIDERFAQVDKRFEQVDKRFEQVDKRFDRIEGDIVVLRAKLDRILIGLLLGFPTVLGTILVKG